MTPREGASGWSEVEHDLRSRLESGETVVVNMSRAKGAPHKNLVEWAKDTGRFVRIDRKSKWGNPYEMGAEAERDQVIAAYRKDLRGDLKLQVAAIEELSGGKALGCWCSPMRCHGDAIIEVIDEAAAASYIEGTHSLPEADVELRERIYHYVVKNSNGRHTNKIQRLYDLWYEWNGRYYAGAMVVPLILLNEPSNPRRLGDCGPTSGFGCSSQIRLRPSLLAGTHPMMAQGSQDPEGKFLFTADCLLHEQIHQYQQEIADKREDGYHGHGPLFRDIANRIGKDLGLPPVRTKQARKGEEECPLCSYWPHAVRTEKYYHGAVDLSGYRNNGVPTRVDAKTDGALLGEVTQLVAAYGYDEVVKAVRMYKDS